jgi:hypothetical protein
LFCQKPWILKLFNISTHAGCNLVDDHLIVDANEKLERTKAVFVLGTKGREVAIRVDAGEDCNSNAMMSIRSVDGEAKDDEGIRHRS